MKNDTLSKALIATLFITVLTVSTTSHAGSRVKPPIAEAQADLSWYQSIVDFFNF